MTDHRVVALSPRQPSASGTKSKAKLATAILTEDSAAVRFANLYRDRLRFDHTNSAWFEWNGAIWRRNETGIAFQWARTLARELAASEPDKVRYISSKTSFAAGVERFSRVDPAFAVTAETWDRDPFLLGTPEGTIDLRTGRLGEGRPEDGITKSTSVAPLAKALCPLWDRFLEQATNGDAALVRFLRQWAGYSLTGDTREHALAFVHGDGGNGKGVFLRAITEIMASYAVTSTMDTFVASQGERHSTDLAMMRGARMVTASETEEGRAWAEARIKSLTGGDPITARFMRQDNFTFRPAFKLMIVGNHKPVLKNVDDAARRRFNLIPFVHKPSQPDPTLDERLKAEWPGILRWMIEGCLDWQKNGLLRPEAVKNATADYFDEQDVFAQWLEQECDCEPGNTWKWETSAALFSSWSAFAIKSGEKPGSSKALSAQLAKHRFEQRKTNAGRGYQGIRLKAVPNHHEPLEHGA